VRQLRVTRRRSARREAPADVEPGAVPADRSGRAEAAAATLSLIDEVLGEA
jgi:hypothetical protein